MSSLLILTGPPGSGNHLWSKVFAMHPDVYGWRSLLNTHWESHAHEPFADMWKDPNLAHDFDWDQHEYYVTNISCPYYRSDQAHVPDFVEFIETVQDHVDCIQVGILGRDPNIIEFQQERVTGRPTVDVAISNYENYLLDTQDVHFLSMELLMLYGVAYLERLDQQLDFPIATWDTQLAEVIAEDANRKYLKPAYEYWLDSDARRANRES